MPRTSFLERFFSKVQITDACWIWFGAKAQDGYGRMHARNATEIYAHRFSWEFFNRSPVPDGLLVIHSCDFPSCVNPKHLFIGSDKDNQVDACRKGRKAKKLTWCDVEVLRERAQQGHSIIGLARDYGIGKSYAYQVVKGIFWKYRPLTANRDSCHRPAVSNDGRSTRKAFTCGQAALKTGTAANR